MKKQSLPLSDAVATVDITGPEILAHGYRDYERYDVTIHREGDTPLKQQRDVVRGGGVIGLLAVDAARDEVVLIRQFRLAAHLANGRGDLIEIVAGRIDEGEAAEAAARRECLEEIGIAPRRLVEMFDLFPTPGLTDEHIVFYVGFVDAEKVPERGGLAHESEDTRPMRISIDDALAALAQGTMKNALLIVALQWLALNRHRLVDLAV
jgi:ADP-ribose pyrophosphatase